MSKRLCNVCEKVELHHDNKSGVCRKCKATAREATAAAPDRKSQAAGEKAEPAARTKKPRAAAAAAAASRSGAMVFERTDKEPRRPFVGLNLLVIEAVGKAKASVADIAAHFEKSSAFKKSKQDASHAARWHAWHLSKKGFLRKHRASA